jgi:hypothetical protein
MVTGEPEALSSMGTHGSRIEEGQAASINPMNGGIILQKKYIDYRLKKDTVNQINIG